MSNKTVIDFIPSKKYANLGAKKKMPKQKPRAPLRGPASVDANRNKKNRTFEITGLYQLSEFVEVRKIRMRVKSGGPENQIFCAGKKRPTDYYFGDISEYDAKTKKWSAFTWGHIPVESVSLVRELDPNEEIKEITKDAVQGPGKEKRD